MRSLEQTFQSHCNRKALSMSLIQLFTWLLPPLRLKNRLLNSFGHDIAMSAKIGPCLVSGVRRAKLGENVLIGPFNTFKNLSLLHLENEAGIGSWNWISAHPAYQALDPEAGTLALGYGARIESRSYLDCSGTIEVGAYSAVGGQRCTLQSHEPNMRDMIQTVGRIEIGHHTSVGSNVVILKGAKVPECSVLAAHSTMTGKPLADPKPGVYGGTPAKFLAPISGQWFERTQIPITDVAIDGVVGLDRASLARGTEAPQRDALHVVEADGTA
ncbi:hypothetical protein CH291_07020 [Rhodococcus sp. 14-1411-2a]|nr:hypothetical protein CH291_07020 [Rhodococcus sp. 14-1411-2a]